MRLSRRSCARNIRRIKSTRRRSIRNIRKERKVVIAVVENVVAVRPILRANKKKRRRKSTNISTTKRGALRTKEQPREMRLKTR